MAPNHSPVLPFWQDQCCDPFPLIRLLKKQTSVTTWQMTSARKSIKRTTCWHLILSSLVCQGSENNNGNSQWFLGWRQKEDHTLWTVTRTSPWPFFFKNFALKATFSSQFPQTNIGESRRRTHWKGGDACLFFTSFNTWDGEEGAVFSGMTRLLIFSTGSHACWSI